MITTDFNNYKNHPYILARISNIHPLHVFLSLSLKTSDTLIINLQVEQIHEAKVPKYLQVSVDVLADRDPGVPQHVRSGH